MMPYPLFQRHTTLRARVKQTIAHAKRVFLFLDFDGTLAPIRKKPSLAMLPAATEVILRRLAKRPNVVVCIVTGRSQADIKEKIRMSNIHWITNHGFEISIGRSHWIHQGALQARPVLVEISRKLKRELSVVQGVHIENKRYTLTVHYRNVRKQSVPVVKETTEGLLRPYEAKFKITRGKKVFEVRPDVPWNKGRAVDRVLKLLRAGKMSLVVYVGDDRTDEDAFKLLHGRGLTVLVGGRRQSAARYRVQNPSAVAVFLKALDASGRNVEKG